MAREGAGDVDLDDVPGREEMPRRFDLRAWAKSIMGEAAESRVDPGRATWLARDACAPR